MNDFHKVFKSSHQSGSVLAQTVLKEHLQTLEKDLRSQSENFLNGRNLDELLERTDELEKLFDTTTSTGQDNFNKLTNFYIEEFNNGRLQDFPEDIAKFASELTQQEAESYAKIMLALAGCSNMNINEHVAEPFLKAWVKMHADIDELRKAWNTGSIVEEIDEVLLKSLDEHLAASSTGFDDILLAAASDNKYILRFIEQKTNSYYNIVNYIRKGQSKIADNIVNNINVLMDDIANELVDLGLSMDEALEITTELNRKYRYTQNIQGFDFLKKAKSSNHGLALLDAVDGNIDLANKLLKGSIEQHQILSLIQNRHALGTFVDSSGLIRCTDELITEINIKTFVDNLGSYVEIKLPADVFDPTFIRNGNDIQIQIKGFNDIINSLDPLTDEYKAYMKLQQVIDEALTNAGLDNVLLEGLSEAEIPAKINEMHQAIYKSLMDTVDENGNCLFESLNIFSSGQTYSCLETLNDQGEEPGEYLARMFESVGVSTFHGYQHWDNPFGDSFRYLFMRGGDQLDESWKAYHKFLFGHLASSGKWEVENLEEMLDIMKQLEDEPELFAQFGQQLVRDLSRPLAVPDGHWFNNANTKKAFVFFDKENLQPVKVISSGDKVDETVAGLLYDMNDFYKQNTHLNKNLLRRPLKIKMHDGRLRIVWSSSPEVVNAWRKHLLEIGIPAGILDELKDGISFSAKRGNVKERLVAFAVIWSEYRKTWDEFADWTAESFQANKLAWHNGVQIGQEARIRFNLGKWQFQDNDGDWIDVVLGTAGRCAQSGSQSSYIYQDVFGATRGGMNIFPCHNGLFQYYVDKIINEFCRLILNKPESKKIGDIIEYILTNWSF